MKTHSSTGEPDGLQSMEATKSLTRLKQLSTHTCTSMSINILEKISGKNHSFLSHYPTPYYIWFHLAYILPFFLNLTFISDPRLDATNTSGSLEFGYRAWFLLPFRRAQSSCSCFLLLPPLLSLLPYMDPSQLLPLGWCPDQAMFFLHLIKQKGEHQTLSLSLRTKSRLLCFQLNLPRRSSCQVPLSYHMNVLPEP